jgi:hypothetical protein
MTAHHKGRDATGAVDKDRRGKATKMDRETNEADRGGDLRGLGRQEREQQQRADEQTEDVVRRGPRTAESLIPEAQRGRR